MSIQESVMEKLNLLPPGKQKQVLNYVEALQQSAARQPSATDSNNPHEWLKIAAGMNLDGPADLSEHLDDYLYRNGGDSKS
jgi:hypothetical protein